MDTIETFLYCLLLTSHLCLLVDISSLQKRPMCKLNYMVASFISAIVPAYLIKYPPINLHMIKWGLVGMSLLIGSLIATLFIQRVINVDIDF